MDVRKKMDVDTFITESLVSIAKGIRRANKTMLEEASQEGNRAHFRLGANDWAQSIEFDIAVTASKETGGGVGVAVLPLELGGQRKVTHEHASGIKFSVKVDVGIT